MGKKIIAVVGNPNSGKTTLFNALTGSTQRVGNWPGVTVEKKEGTFQAGGANIQVVDLPGIYSLDATSEDEKIALNYVLSGEPGLIINIIDATNLERNLYLTVQLLEMKLPVVVVLNMLDIAEGRDIKIDQKKLSAVLACPVYGISAIKKGDTETIKEVLGEEVKKIQKSSIHVLYPNDVTEWLDGNEKYFSKTAKAMNVPERWVALRILEKTDIIIEKAKKYEEIDDNDIEESLKFLWVGSASDLAIADSRYRHISGIIDEATKAKEAKKTLTDKIDKIILNRILGIPIFLLAMYMVFWVTLSIGGAFIDFFDIAFGAIFVDFLGGVLSMIGSPEWLTTLLASGIGAGIQTVSTFVPIVFTMFICISIMEDSGYMARAAFVMDRLMKAIGLPGKSFVPMLVGFGCTVPAIMATRTLESTRDRILTVFMTPFMSCGARLPVYALFGAAFFGVKSGLMVFSIYMAGGLLAIVTGLIMKNTLFKGEPSYFIMELPPYHAPRPFSVLRHSWYRLKTFIIRAGKVVVISVALLGFFNSMGTDGSFGNEDAEDSVLAAVGKSITPVFKPMGLDEDNWPATVALFTGLFAKEAVVGTLNSLYSQTDAQTWGAAEETEDEAVEAEELGLVVGLGAGISEAFATIPDNLLGVMGGLLDPFGIGILEEDEDTIAEEVGADTSVFTSMRTHFTEGPFQVYAYLLFILLYVPCMAAMGAVAREIGGKMALVLAAYLTLLAWIVSTLVYQIGVGHNPLWISIALVLFVSIIVIFKMFGKSIQKSKRISVS